MRTLQVGATTLALVIAFTVGQWVGHQDTCAMVAYAITHTNDGIAYSTDLIEPVCP